MRKITRILALVLVAAMLMTAFAACGKKIESKYIGVWEGTTAEYAGMELDVNDLFGGFTVELTDTGKVTLTVDGDAETGKWEEIDGGFRLDGDDDMTFYENDDGSVTMDYDDVLITLVKK